MKKYVIRHAYGKKKRIGDIGDLGKSLTKQSFTKECDINNIMAKYQKTGAIDHVNKHEASYGYATSDDFTASMEIVGRGQTMFAELPSSIRTKFENDPAKFLEFVQNPENIKEMQELGLAHKLQQTEEELSLLKPKNQEYQHGVDEKTTTKSVKTGDSGDKEVAS